MHVPLTLDGGVKPGAHVAVSMHLYMVHRHLPKFDSHSSLGPLVQALDPQVLPFDFFWQKWARRHWRLGHYARTAGNRLSNSTWNVWAPWLDERRVLRQVRSCPGIVHFLWGEFASPRTKRSYHRVGSLCLGTFHCSARRLPEVLRGFDPVGRYDAITLMSKTQEAFFLEKGFPAECMRVILHGVDTAFFCPGGEARSPAGKRLRLLLVGDTERDHEFAARLFAQLPEDRFEIAVKTNDRNWGHYGGIPSLELLPRLDGEGLRQAYRDADLLVLPLLDCTANNAVLEAMACGTPVMVNRVGGIPEYVSEEAGVLCEQRSLEEWQDRLLALCADRAGLAAMRPAARARAERFAWERIVPLYQAVYQDLERRLS